MTIVENDLYALPVDGLKLQRCGGNLQSGMETCVEFAPLPGATDAYVVGDTKNPSAGTLRFTGAELEDFFSRWQQRRGA